MKPSGVVTKLSGQCAQMYAAVWDAMVKFEQQVVLEGGLYKSELKNGVYFPAVFVPAVKVPSLSISISCSYTHHGIDKSDE